MQLNSIDASRGQVQEYQIKQGVLSIHSSKIISKENARLAKRQEIRSHLPRWCLLQGVQCEPSPTSLWNMTTKQKHKAVSRGSPNWLTETQSASRAHEADEADFKGMLLAQDRLVSTDRSCELMERLGDRGDRGIYASRVPRWIWI